MKKPLAEMVLFGALSEKGGTVQIAVVDDKIVIEAEEVLVAS